MSVVYITGASAGLGRAIAQNFSKAGHSVGLIARDPKALAETADTLPGKTAWACADITIFEELDSAAAQLEKDIGAPDIWINNAMATIFSRFEDISPAEFSQSVNTTFMGSVFGLQIALKMMKPRGKGQIIQIGSALAYRAIPLQAPYCASKFAIRGALSSLRCELMHDKSPLCVTMVDMPAMNTPQFDWAARHVAQHPMPVPPIYAPEACAKAVYWASEHPHMREVWVGKPTWKAIIGNKLMPDFMDRYMSKNAYEAQFEKPAAQKDEEGNLFHTMENYHATKGHFGSKELQKVLWIGVSEKREMLFFGTLSIALSLIILGILL